MPRHSMGRFTPRPPFNFSAAKRAITHQDGKGILVTANYGQMQNACVEYKWICYKTNNAKQKALFLFLMSCDLIVRPITYCWPVYHSQPLEQLQLLQYFKLQMVKTVIFVVQVYNTYQPAMHG